MEKQDSPQSVWYHPESIAVITAKTLNEADIPCFLWGDYSISLWGVNDVETTIDFVVHDDLADKAIQTLLDAQPYARPISACSHPGQCEESDKDSYSFPSKRHLHWSDWSEMTHWEEVRFQIFARSELLSLPPMDALPSAYADNAALAEAIRPHYLLASDTSHLPPRESILQAGAFKPGRHPVIAPMPHVVVEAEMRLFARYIQTNWVYQWSYNQAALGADGGVVDTELMSDPVLRDLFIRSRDVTFKEPGEYARLLTAALGEKPYIELPILAQSEQFARGGAAGASEGKI